MKIDMPFNKEIEPNRICYLNGKTGEKNPYKQNKTKKKKKKKKKEAKQMNLQ